MNEVNQTLYIPLYGKVLVSRRGIILSDKKAEEIWDREGFPLNGKAKSKWLAYYMGMRSAVFDNWLKAQMDKNPNAVILHIGCGMDSRICRVGTQGHLWFDVDFPQVIAQRKEYYQENDGYTMLAADARQTQWLREIPSENDVVVVMEGISMYMDRDSICNLFQALQAHFGSVTLLMDTYTTMAAKISRYKNPVNEVGVTTLYGIDEPEELSVLKFTTEHDLTPQYFIDQLTGFEKRFFKFMFAGSFARKLYRLYEYKAE